MAELARVEGGIHFLQRHCEIHGRFGDQVYRRKRNGQEWIYEYQYHPKYAATVLSRRSDAILKAAARVTNPQYKGFKTIINKIYYYTPYLVYAGSYNFTCNTFFKLRSKGNYRLQIDNVMLGMKLAPRSKIELTFTQERAYTVRCYKNEMLYSEREVIVLPDSSDLQDAYAAWFDANLNKLLRKPKPGILSLNIYRRGIKPPNWIWNLSGKTGDNVLYALPKKHFVYVRKTYQHEHNSTGNYFYNVQPRINTCWRKCCREFTLIFKKYFKAWYRVEHGRQNKAVSPANLWSKLLFRAGAELGFDLEQLSKDNWLPGVETLLDLITAAGFSRYHLSKAELSVNIF